MCPFPGVCMYTIFICETHINPRVYKSVEPRKYMIIHQGKVKVINKIVMALQIMVIGKQPTECHIWA